MKQYYYLHNNQQVGPVPMDQLASKPITPTTLMWAEGMPDWIPANQIPELQAVLVRPTPNPAPGMNPGMNPGTSPAPGYQQPKAFSHDPFDFGAPVEENIHHTPPTIDSESLNKRWSWYNITLWGSFAAIPLIIIFAILSEERVMDDDLGVALAGFTAFIWFGALIASGIIGLTILYKGWENIQDGKQVRTEPGTAIGYLFIPIYQYYWLFQAFKGFAEDGNAYVREKNYSKDEVFNEGMALTSNIFSLVAAIPYIGWFLAFIPALILHYLMMSNFKKGISLIVDAKANATGGMNPYR